MKILICGGRTFGVPQKTMSYKEIQKKLMERSFIFSSLDFYYTTIHEITKIISGACTGPDLISIEWARKNEIPFKLYPANWETHGRAAGSIRNSEMLEKEYIDEAFVFPGGPGTKDMETKLIKRLIPIWYPTERDLHENEKT